MKPRILIADDHPLIAEGLAALLAPDFLVIGREADGRASVETAIRLKPDVVILDISMPGGSGLDAARQIRSRDSGVRILILTQHSEWAYVQAAFAAGASGYVTKNAAASHLRTAIRRVMEGKIYISSGLKAAHPKRIGRVQDPTALSRDALTGRQGEILNFLARGMTAKEMAAVLNVSTKTIEYHKSMIAEKLQLRTTAELAVFAYQRGFIT
jgi:DNA-binding NarL/FixJ family response regulator